KLFSGGGTNRSVLHASLQDFSEVLKEIHFEGEPRLQLNLSGDARNVHSIIARLDATATGVQTPWFYARDFQASARLTAPENIPDNSDSSWGLWTNLQP